MLRMLLLVSWGLTLAAQTQVDLRTQARNIDFSAANSTRPIKTGTALPATCVAGNMFFKTDAPGAGDIIANASPVDPTRGLFKWASAMQGQAATQTGAQAAFLGCQNLAWCISQLEWWVRQGYQPANLALKGKAHDGGPPWITSCCIQWLFSRE